MLPKEQLSCLRAVLKNLGMIIIAVIAVLVGFTAAQLQSTSSDDQHQSLESGFFYEAAPLHYVNIGSKLAGDYKFAYDTGKGPMGQSFREETRLADGTVKGSYGAIDEAGHKRIVHFSSGKNLWPQTISKSTISPFRTTQQQSNLLIQHQINSFPQQQQIFKPSNYLQSRAKHPVHVEQVKVTSQKKFMLEKQKPAEKMKKHVTPVYKFTVPTPVVDVVQPVYSSTSSVSTEQATVPTTPRPTMSQKHQGSITALAEMYQSLKRVPKTTTIPRKLSTIAYKVNGASEKSYEPATEEDYYDSAPAFFDIARLSYNIGTDKFSSL